MGVRRIARAGAERNRNQIDHSRAHGFVYRSFGPFCRHTGLRWQYEVCLASPVEAEAEASGRGYATQAAKDAACEALRVQVEGNLGKCHGGPAAPQGLRGSKPGATVTGGAAAPQGPPVPVQGRPRRAMVCVCVCVCV